MKPWIEAFLMMYGGLAVSMFAFGVLLGLILVFGGCAKLNPDWTMAYRSCYNQLTDHGKKEVYVEGKYRDIEYCRAVADAYAPRSVE